MVKNIYKEIFNKNHEKIINIFLRSATLGLRFIFIFFLARYMTPGDVGYYGLFTSAVAYAIYFFGLDFYIYSTREIITTPNERRGILLKNQIYLSGILYFLLLPASLLLLNWAGWPIWLVAWFIPILLFEHINQEVYRLLIALSQQTAANVQLFVRQGSWAIVAVLLMVAYPDSRRLDVILILWTLAGFSALIVGVSALLRLGIGGWGSPIDKNWIRTGVRISIVFLSATLALRGIQTLDRYWLEALGGIEAVGAYALFLGVASALLVFLDAGVFAFAYPKLIELAQTGAYPEMRIRLRWMLLQVLVASGIFSIISWLLMPTLLNWVGHSLYRDNLGFYPWVLTATVLNAIGLVPHYALYARHRDKQIVVSHLLAVPAFVLGVWLLGPWLGVSAVPAGLCIAFLLILVLKSLAWLSMDQVASRPEGPENFL